MCAFFNCYICIMKESATRKRIMQVASRLFYKQGYNSTGINQIIEEAGIARGSLYNHFPSKRDLLTAYIQAMDESSVAEWDEVIAGIKDTRKKILAVYDICIDRQIRSDFGGCPFIKVGAEIQCEDVDAFQMINKQKNADKSYFEKLIKELYLTNAEYAGKELLAATLFLLMEGAMVTSTIAKDLEPLRNARKIAESLL